MPDNLCVRRVPHATSRYGRGDTGVGEALPRGLRLILALNDGKVLLADPGFFFWPEGRAAAPACQAAEPR